MYHLILAKIIAIVVVTLFSGFKGPNPFEFKDLGRIGFGPPAPPAPPAQLFFPSSADWADDFRLSSRTNFTFSVAVPPSPLHHLGSVGNSSADNLPSPFPSSPSPTRVLLGFYHGAAKIASWGSATVHVAALQILRATSWVLATALVAALQVLTASFWVFATVLVAALQALASSEPLAIAAQALRDRNSRDRLDLEVGAVESVASFWKVAAWADYQHGILTILRAQLKRSEEDRGSMDARIRRIEKDNSVLARQAAESSDKILAMASTAAERFDKAQQAATELIRFLEAQQREGEKTRAKLDADLKAARQHIVSLQSTISSQVQRLPAGPGSFQHRPPPPSFPSPPHPPMSMRAPPPSFASSFPLPVPPPPNPSSFPLPGPPASHSAPPTSSSPAPLQPRPAPPPPHRPLPPSHLPGSPGFSTSAIPSFHGTGVFTGSQPPYHPGRGRGGAGRGGRGGR
ncbi:hypothetical protein MMC07_001668 [Pseudocyphellaria aurata]|nr:hypothetical protein [Pseudocyphellaria aurata]